MEPCRYSHLNLCGRDVAGNDSAAVILYFLQVFTDVLLSDVLLSVGGS